MKRHLMIVSLAAFAISCTPGPLPTSGTPAPSDKYPTWVKTTFNQGCRAKTTEATQLGISAGDYQKFCGCMIDTIERTVKIEDFITHLKTTDDLLDRSPYRPIAESCLISSLS